MSMSPGKKNTVVKIATLCEGNFVGEGDLLNQIPFREFSCKALEMTKVFLLS